MDFEFTTSQLFVLGALGVACGLLAFWSARIATLPMRVFVAAGALFIPYMLAGFGQALFV